MDTSLDHITQLHQSLRCRGLLAGNDSLVLQGDADLSQKCKGKYRKLLMSSAWDKFNQWSQNKSCHLLKIWTQTQGPHKPTSLALTSLAILALGSRP